MAKKEDLFFLIKSLTPAEKRYFRLFSKQNSPSSNYNQLFDTIDRQSVYDEAAIRRKFAGAPFLKQLHVTKNYLIRQILKSQRNYHAKDSHYAEVFDCLRDIEILFLKELYELCGSEIQRGLKIARQFEYWEAALKLLGWQRRLMLTLKAVPWQREKLLELREEERDIIQKLDHQSQLWSMSINAFNLIKESAGKGICKTHPLLNTFPENEAQQTQILYHYLHQTEQYFFRNMPAAAKTAADLIAFLEKRPDLIKENPQTYMTATSNLIGILLQLKEYDRIKALLPRIHQPPGKFGLSKHPGSIRMRIHAFNVELEMYRDTCDVENGLMLIENINGFLKQNRAKVSNDYLLLFYYQFAYLYFLGRDYQQSLKWVNEIFTGELHKGRDDIVSYAHLLRLILHYELNNTMLLKYQVDSCRRFLKKKSRLQQFESSLLNFFVRLCMAHPEKHPEMFITFKAQLLEAHPLESIKSNLDYLDFVTWIDQKTNS